MNGSETATPINMNIPDRTMLAFLNNWEVIRV